MLFLFLGSFIFAQGTFVDSTSEAEPSVNSVGAEKGANQILDGCEVLTEQLATYFASDVFEAYQLENDYTTPLQREEYAKSAEYGRHLEQLRNAQEEMKSRVFCLPLGRLNAYDTKRRGFFFKSGDFNVADDTYRQKNVLWSYDVAVSVPGANKVFYPNPYNWHYEFFLSVPSNLALEIEKDSSSELYMAVKLTGIKRHSTSFGYRHSSQHFIIAKFIRFIVANAEEGRVYWSK